VSILRINYLIAFCCCLFGVSLGQSARSQSQSSTPVDTGSTLNQDELRELWVAHPGPLILDAHNWYPSSVSTAEDGTIRAESLSEVAQMSLRRHVAVGRADVFARRKDVPSLMAVGEIAGMWDFVRTRSDALFKGLSFQQLSAEERELILSASRANPSVNQAVQERKDEPIHLRAIISILQEGEERTFFTIPEKINRQPSTRPSGHAEWMTPKLTTEELPKSLDFGEGRLLSVQQVMAILSGMGYSCRYDARLEGSKIFLKGKFTTVEVLDGMREVLDTIPFFAQDRRAIVKYAAKTYRELVIKGLVEEGFPQELAERIGDDGRARFTREELMNVPIIARRFGPVWQDLSVEESLTARLMLYADCGEDWVTPLPGGQMWSAHAGIWRRIITPG
jgi:hypothetical protein